MSEQELFRTCLSKAMALCSRREYSPSDIRTKAASWGLGSERITELIKILEKENFLNEMRYAKAYVNDKYLYNGWGRIKISAGLRLHGISEETIRESLAQIDEEKYLENLRKLIYNQKRKVKAASEYELRGKLMRFGASRGFESGILYDLLGDL